jgi:hypothetical protein
MENGNQPKSGIEQQAGNSTLGGGMLANQGDNNNSAQGDGIIQQQPNSNLVIQNLEDVKAGRDININVYAGDSSKLEKPKIFQAPPPGLAVVQKNAQRARTTLEPYILPRIRRESVLEKCLNAIHRGVVEEKRRVVPILGAAGYGKSTILGTIYDDLTGKEQGQRYAELGWVALVRCNDLIENYDTFVTELGEKVSGVRESIVDIADRLNTLHGRGVLLIDTLDLVLGKKLVPVLRGMLSQLLDKGTTVVFTCRDADYRDFFEPYHESFAGFNESIERCQIPLFEDVEVQEAASAFCARELQQTEDAAMIFAEKIISLSADSKSLADITRNPLLLALLCKLFAQEGNVPKDLTVSQLYQSYWDWPIATTRKQRQDSRRIGRVKKNLCLQLAEMMYNASTERLRDFVYESQVELDDTEFIAYEELISDGVLHELGAERVSFFHQTFLEFAIARFFVSTPRGESEKQSILNTITNTENIYSRYFIWSIVRQLLNLINLDEFYAVSNTLNKEELSPFRTVALASVSRNEPESSRLLLQLLPIALKLGDAYQDVLLVAASGAPTRHNETVWLLILELLSTTGQALINKTAELAGELLVRKNNQSNNPIEQIYSAVRKRQYPPELNAESETIKTLGQVISNYARAPKPKNYQIDTNLLNSLKSLYFSFGSNARAVIVQLYFSLASSDTLQYDFLVDFLLFVSQQPITDSAYEKKYLVELLKILFPNLLEQGNSPFGSSWMSALYVNLPEGWSLIQTAVVGYQSLSDVNLLENLVHGLFSEITSQEDSDKIRRHQMAIAEAINLGAGNSFVSILLNIPIESIPENRFPTILLLIKKNIVDQDDEAFKLTPELNLALANWIATKVNTHSAEIIPVIDALASHNSEVEVLLSNLFNKILAEQTSQKINAIIKKFKYVSEIFEPYLRSTSSSKESRAALVKIYLRQAKNTYLGINSEKSELAIRALLNFCLDDSRDVALGANTIFSTITHELFSIPVSDFIPILVRAKNIGVRNSCLKSLIQRVELNGVVTATEVMELCTALKNENTPEILQPLYDFIKTWVHINSQIPNELAQFTFELTDRLISQGKGKIINGGIASGAFVLLKHIANLEISDLNDELAKSTRNLLRATDVREVNRVYVIGLLDRISRIDQDFLSQVVKEDLVTELGVLPPANLYSVVIAIIYNRGKDSALLDEILANPNIPLETKGRIIKEREG